MTGSVDGPLPTSVMPSSSPALRPLSPGRTKEKDAVEITLEVDVDRISVAMGSRLVVSFVELVLYLKGQAPFPPSTLRMMTVNGRKSSPQQTKLLKSLHALSEDLPSTLDTLHTPQSVTFALVFGLGRVKCFVQLSGTDFTKFDTIPDDMSLAPETTNENADSIAETPKRRSSSRQPLREITPPSSPPVDDLASTLSSISISTKPPSSESVIRKAERALAQAMACSDMTLGTNLGPMGVQVYVRASRVFNHPKWVVRQDIARTLDGAYDSMMSGGHTTECVKVRARVESDSPDEREMIWWGWEGRLQGYP